MLGDDGAPLIGHGIIKRVDMNVLAAQVDKRNQNSHDYDKRIIDEFRSEQLDFYKVVKAVAEAHADQKYQRDTPDWKYWMDRFIFIAALTYKFISVGIESRWMEEDIRL